MKGLYIIESGKAVVVKVDENNNRDVVAEIGRNDCFGLATVL